jgi:hypothetical protein
MRPVVTLAAMLVTASLTGAQAPVDTSKIGPPVGAAVPPISGTDQFGKPRTLASIYGPKGAMVVFYRSASW